MAAHTDDGPARHATGDAAQVRDADNNETDAQIPENVLAGALEAGENHARLQNDQTQIAQSERLVKKRTSEEQTVAFLAAIEAGIGTREAARQCDINLRTAYGLLARSDADLDVLQAATRRIMAVETLDRLDDWRTAARVGAAKRGNHLPAKDWLLHAGIIEPLQGEHQAGIRIAINIGTEDRPMKIVSPLAQKDEE